MLQQLLKNCFLRQSMAGLNLRRWCDTAYTKTNQKQTQKCCWTHWNLYPVIPVTATLLNHPLTLQWELRTPCCRWHAAWREAGLCVDKPSSPRGRARACNHSPPVTRALTAAASWDCIKACSHRAGSTEEARPLRWEKAHPAQTLETYLAYFSLFISDYISLSTLSSLLFSEIQGVIYTFFALFHSCNCLATMKTVALILALAVITGKFSSPHLFIYKHFILCVFVLKLLFYMCAF